VWNLGTEFYFSLALCIIALFFFVLMLPWRNLRWLKYYFFYDRWLVLFPPQSLEECFIYIWFNKLIICYCLFPLKHVFLNYFIMYYKFYFYFFPIFILTLGYVLPWDSTSRTKIMLDHLCLIFKIITFIFVALFPLSFYSEFIMIFFKPCLMFIIGF
jgi:hypothetical protein